MKLIFKLLQLTDIEFLLKLIQQQLSFNLIISEQFLVNN